MQKYTLFQEKYSQDFAKTPAEFNGLAYIQLLAVLVGVLAIYYVYFYFKSFIWNSGRCDDSAVFIS